MVEAHCGQGCEADWSRAGHACATGVLTSCCQNDDDDDDDDVQLLYLTKNEYVIS